MAVTTFIGIVGLLSIQALSIITAQSCNTEVSQLRLRISQAASQSRMDVGTVVTKTRIDIASARQNINTQLSELYKRVQQVASINSESCTSSLHADLAQLNEASIYTCWNNNDFAAINRKIDQISNLKRDANLCCRVDEQQCLTSGINDIDNNLLSLTSQVSADIQNLQNQSSKCIDTEENRQINVINTASTNFDNCL